MLQLHSFILEPHLLIHGVPAVCDSENSWHWSRVSFGQSILIESTTKSHITNDYFVCYESELDRRKP